ncbi:MAG: DsbA family protein [Candidatus Aenigmatarchaeota archaeon]
MQKQLDVFWDFTCPHCRKKIDIEILVNALKLKD